MNSNRPPSAKVQENQEKSRIRELENEVQSLRSKLT